MPFESPPSESLSSAADTEQLNNGAHLSILATGARLPSRDALPAWITANIGDPKMHSIAIRSRAERAEKIREEVGLIIGNDPRMQEVWEQVQRAARGDGHVLLRGQPGTGKEVFAKAIHWLRGRNGTFYAVNCPGFSPDLVESELFGHVKGAFTGAIADRKGAFELASKGTLLLDEVGDMLPEHQAKLLRVLETMEFSRVGEGKMMSCRETKIVAATNRPLEKLRQQDLFREDIFSRLSANEIFVPPLFERTREHRIALVGHILGFLRAKEKVSMTTEALEFILMQRYPQNVREMRDHLARACNAADYVDGTDIVIEAKHIEETLPSHTASTNEKPSVSQQHLNALLLRQSQRGRQLHIDIDLLRMGELHLILETIAATIAAMTQKLKGTQTAAANSLGITRDKQRKLVSIAGSRADENGYIGNIEV